MPRRPREVAALLLACGAAVALVAVILSSVAGSGRAGTANAPTTGAAGPDSTAPAGGGHATAGQTTTTEASSSPGLRSETITLSHPSPPSYSVSCSYPQLGNSAGRKSAIVDLALKAAASASVLRFEALVKSVQADPSASGAGASLLSCSWRSTLASRLLASFVFVGSAFVAGAAHPLATAETFTFDLASGRRVALAGLFRRGSPWLEVLSSETRKLLALLPSVNGSPTLAAGTAPELSSFSAWSLTKAGLQITFQEYQVAPYALGMPTVTIPLRDLRSVAAPGGPLAGAG